MDSSSEDEQLQDCSPCRTCKNHLPQTKGFTPSKAWHLANGACMPLPTCSSIPTDQESSDSDSDAELQLVFSNIDWSNMDKQEDIMASAGFTEGKLPSALHSTCTTRTGAMSPTAAAASSNSAQAGSQATPAGIRLASPSQSMQAAAVRDLGVHTFPITQQGMQCAVSIDLGGNELSRQAPQQEAVQHPATAACTNSDRSKQASKPEKEGQLSQPASRASRQSTSQTCCQQDVGVRWLSGAAGRLSDLSSPRHHQAETPSFDMHKAPGSEADQSASTSQQAADVQAQGEEDEDAALTAAFHVAIMQPRQSQAGNSSGMVLDDLAGMSMNDLDTLIARLQAGEVNMDLTRSRPADLPDPATLFSDSEDEGDTLATSLQTTSSHARPANISMLPATRAQLHATQMQVPISSHVYASQNRQLLPQMQVQGQVHEKIHQRSTPGPASQEPAAAPPQQVSTSAASAPAIQQLHQPVALPPRFRALAAGNAMPVPQPAMLADTSNANAGMCSCSLQNSGRADARATVIVDLRGAQQQHGVPIHPRPTPPAMAPPEQPALRSTRSTFVSCIPPSDAMGAATGIAAAASKPVQVDGTATAAPASQEHRQLPQAAAPGRLQSSSNSSTCAVQDATASSWSFQQQPLTDMLHAQIDTECADNGEDAVGWAVSRGMRMHALPEHAPGQLLEAGVKLVPAGLRIPVWQHASEQQQQQAQPVKHMADATTGCDDLLHDSLAANTRGKGAGSTLLHADASCESDQHSGGGGLWSTLSMKHAASIDDVHQDNHDSRWLVGVHV